MSANVIGSAGEVCESYAGAPHDRQAAFAPRAVLEGSGPAALGDGGAVLALVLETEGSTYVRAGAAALFGERRLGWLSGGCLETEIASSATDAASRGRIEWLEVDTRDDESMFAPSAVGCRGRLRLALLPLGCLTGWGGWMRRWTSEPVALSLSIDSRGDMLLRLGPDQHHWHIGAADCPWPESTGWSINFGELPRLLVFGGGPESASLLPVARSLGWRTLLVERRTRWAAQEAFADRRLSCRPADAVRDDEASRAMAALVMHHHFEFDRDALEALAPTSIGFIGLLGPHRRGDELLRLLPASARHALARRLRAPVGLDLGGRGPEAIALSIAAQLQAWMHGKPFDA